MKPRDAGFSESVMWEPFSAFQLAPNELATLAVVQGLARKQSGIRVVCIAWLITPTHTRASVDAPFLVGR